MATPQEAPNNPTEINPSTQTPQDMFFVNEDGEQVLKPGVIPSDAILWDIETGANLT